MLAINSKLKSRNAITREAAPVVDEPAMRAARRALILARFMSLTWWLVVMSMGGLFAAALPARYSELLIVQNSSQTPADLFRSVDTQKVKHSLAELALSTDVYAVYNLALEILFASVFFFIAALIYRRKSGDATTFIVSLTLIFFGTAAIPTMFALAWQEPAWELPIRLLNTMSWIFLLIFFYVFPDGRYTSKSSKVILALYVLWELSFTFFPDAFFSPYAWPAWMAVSAWAMWFSSGLVAQLRAYRTIYTPQQRKQTKWVLYAMSIAVAGVILMAAPNVLYKSNILAEHPGPLYELIRLPVHYVLAALLPVAIAVAIIRANLFNIDTLISRTLVYVPLTAILAGLYSASIALFQRLFMATTGERSDAAVVITTLFLASTFTPIKNGLQAFVDKRFKEVPDPTKGLKGLLEELEKEVYVLDARKLTRRLLDEAKEGFGAHAGSVYLVRQGELRLVHTVGEWEGKSTVVTTPLRRDDGRVLGRLVLSARANGEEYTDKERETLQQVATAVAAEMREK